MKCKYCDETLGDEDSHGCMALERKETPTDKSPREPYTVIATPKSEYDALVNERDKLQQELDAARAENDRLRVIISSQPHTENIMLRKQLADAKTELAKIKSDVLFNGSKVFYVQAESLQKQLDDARALLGECVGFVEPRYPDFGSPALYVKVVELLNKWKAK